MTVDNRVAKRKVVIRPKAEPTRLSDEAETQPEAGRLFVEHDANTEMLNAHSVAEIVEDIDDASHVAVDDTDVEGATEATTVQITGRAEDQHRLETQKTIFEKAHALDYAISARMEQLKQEQENATLWWKILDRVFQRAGQQQERLYTIQTELKTIGSSLHHPSVHEQTLARIAVLEKELYDTHNVPEILAAPPMEHEGPPLVHASFVGAMKPSHGKERTEGGKLGEFGQDGVRIKAESAISIVFDGVGSLDDSYAVGEAIAEKAEEILNGLPDTKDTELIEAYLHLRYPEILAAMEQLPDTVQGAASFIAKRFLPKSELLVAIKVGDGEIVIERQDGFVKELLPEAANDLQREDGNRKRAQILGVGIMDGGTRKKVKGKSGDDSTGKEPGTIGSSIRKTIATPYRLIMTPAHKGDKVHITTDGVLNNTGRSLIDWVKKGQLVELLGNLTSEKDDVIILTEEL